MTDPRLTAATITRHTFLITDRGPLNIGDRCTVRRLDGSLATATVREQHDAPPGLLRLVLDVPGGIDRAPTT